MPPRYLVTSALPYINGVKHLGNLIGSLLPADVYARFRRQSGAEVLFVCATDEHGTPAELAAAQAGEPPAAYCAAMHRAQADVYRRFALSFDVFGRTSHPHNHRLTQQLYQALRGAGFTEQRDIIQLYSPADGRFLPDRYVVGTCPRCGYEAARGDQCEQCAAVLDPSELLAPRSAISGSRALEQRRTTHVFLRLSALQEAVAGWVAQVADGWGETTRGIATKWLREGLRDRCISRDLSWGVPVPELPGKVFYVWFDAPVGYLSATCEWADARGEPDSWRAWWASGEGDDAVELSQFMAKDNVPFHTIMFPAMLLGGGGTYRLPSRIKGFNWLNYYGGKFSTSQQRGIFIDAALQEFDADVWRYVLLAQAPESKDSAFTWEEFQGRLNKDLNDVFGNLVHRVFSFVASRFGPQVPAGGEVGDDEQALMAAVGAAGSAVAQALAAQEFRRATEHLREAWVLGNTYIDRMAPWKTIAHDQPRAAAVLRTCLQALAAYADLAAPFMPETAAKLARALHQNPGGAEIFSGTAPIDRLAAGAPLTPPPPLFAKIDAARVAALRQRFGGPG